MVEAVRRSVGKIAQDREREETLLRVMVCIEDANTTGEDPVKVILRREQRWKVRRSVRSWIQSNGSGLIKPVKSRSGKHTSRYELTAKGEMVKRTLLSEYCDPEGFKKGPEGSYRETPADLPADLPTKKEKIPPGLRISLERYRVRYPIQVQDPDHRDLPDPWTTDQSDRSPRSWKKWILDLDGFNWRAEKTTRAVFVNIRKVVGQDPDQIHREAARVADLVARYITSSYGIPLGSGELDRRPGSPHFEVHHPEFQKILDGLKVSHLRIEDPGSGQILTVDGSKPGPGIGGDSVEWVEGILKGPERIQELQTRMGGILDLLELHGKALEQISKNTQRLVELRAADLIQDSKR